MDEDRDPRPEPPWDWYRHARERAERELALRREHRQRRVAEREAALARIDSRLELELGQLGEGLEPGQRADLEAELREAAEQRKLGYPEPPPVDQSVEFRVRFDSAMKTLEERGLSEADQREAQRRVELVMGQILMEEAGHSARGEALERRREHLIQLVEVEIQRVAESLEEWQAFASLMESDPDAAEIRAWSTPLRTWKLLPDVERAPLDGRGMSPSNYRHSDHGVLLEYDRQHSQLTGRWWPPRSGIFSKERYAALRRECCPELPELPPSRRVLSDREALARLLTASKLGLDSEHVVARCVARARSALRK